MNHLSHAETERLAKLAEECGEVVQIIGKILCHGFESTHPSGGPANRELLERELGDVKAVVTLMLRARDVNGPFIDNCGRSKLPRLKTVLKHQPEEYYK